MYKEFWYILIFINCPYISIATKTKLEDIVRKMIRSNPCNPSHKVANIVCDFMLLQKKNSFFCWGYYHFNTSKQLTFRTYQRTLFKQYKNRRSIELYGSLDS